MLFSPTIFKLTNHCMTKVNLWFQTVCEADLFGAAGPALDSSLFLPPEIDRYTDTAQALLARFFVSISLTEYKRLALISIFLSSSWQPRSISSMSCLHVYSPPSVPSLTCSSFFKKKNLWKTYFLQVQSTKYM